MKITGSAGRPTPSPARMYAYWLGGKDHFAEDRIAADRIASVAPCVVAAARANRAFVRRAVTAMAREGVVQFLDLGCGLPTSPAVHDLARRAGVDPRVVYVDHDEVVLVHARAIWDGVPGVLAVAGDAREPARVLEDPRCRAYLDLSRPVASWSRASCTAWTTLRSTPRSPSYAPSSRPAATWR